MTWDQLARSLLARHPFATAGADEVRLVLAGGAPRRRVGVIVRAAVAHGQAAVVILADLGAMTRIDPWEGLQVNGLLAFGALAAVDGVLVLRALLLAAELTDAALEGCVQRLAAEAAELEGRLAAGCPATSAFDHYNE